MPHVPWYRRKDYKHIRSIMDDADQFPETVAEAVEAITADHRGWRCLHRHALTPLRALLSRCRNNVEAQNVRVEYR